MNEIHNTSIIKDIGEIYELNSLDSPISKISPIVSTVVNAEPKLIVKSLGHLEQSGDVLTTSTTRDFYLVGFSLSSAISGSNNISSLTFYDEDGLEVYYKVESAPNYGCSSAQTMTFGKRGIKIKRGTALTWYSDAGGSVLVWGYYSGDRG